jgi:hypothetical protein
MAATAGGGGMAAPSGGAAARGATRRRHLQTQRTAQLAVPGELRGRGYQAAAAGGQAAMEMAVHGPGGARYRIAVKGLHKPGFWIIRRRAPDPQLFYVLAYVPEAPARPAFFVLSQADLIAYEAGHLAMAQAQNPAVSEAVQGIHWAPSQVFRDRWDLLPA